MNMMNMFGGAMLFVADGAVDVGLKILNTQMDRGHAQPMAIEAGAKIGRVVNRAHKPFHFGVAGLGKVGQHGLPITNETGRIKLIGQIHGDYTPKNGLIV